jgi:hypothetical protein
VNSEETVKRIKWVQKCLKLYTKRGSLEGIPFAQKLRKDKEFIEFMSWDVE